MVEMIIALRKYNRRSSGFELLQYIVEDQIAAAADSSWLGFKDSSNICNFSSMATGAVAKDE